MKSAIKTIIGWTKLLTTAALLYSLFSFSAMAQDKPLEAEARTALINELKGVVKQSEPDAKKSSMVAQKWTHAEI